MPKLVCTKCQTELLPKTNEVIVVETASFGPYKVWSADLWKCPGCGYEIVAGFADVPIRQDHYMPDFPEWLEKVKTLAKVVVDNEHPAAADQLENNQDLLESASGMPPGATRKLQDSRSKENG
jgi:hypothetical protein